MSAHLNLYEHLANELGALIDSRVFAPGDRLPSIRHLAQQKRISVSTVMQALRLMEDRGQVDARPQSGYFVRHRAPRRPCSADAQHLKEPAFVGINNLLMRVLKDNETANIVQLGTAWPPDEILPIKRMQRTISAVARREPALLSKVSCYDVSEGNFLRQVTRRALDWGKLDPHEIVVTNSCTEAISLCLRAVAKPGDTIAIESATYFVLLQMIESLGMKALEIPTDPKTGPSLDALELALRAGLVQACLFVPNANNPLGCVMPEATQKRLAGLLSEFNIPLVEDDVYGDFLEGSSYDQQLRKMRRTLVQRIARMSDAVAASFPADCMLSEPQGGFVLWVQMPPQIDALALHGQAIADGVAYMPGQLFSASGKFSNYLRLNCGNAWTPRIEQAIGRLGRLVKDSL